jgi:hypothetical protein
MFALRRQPSDEREPLLDVVRMVMRIDANVQRILARLGDDDAEEVDT